MIGGIVSKKKRLKKLSTVSSMAGKHDDKEERHFSLMTFSNLL